MRALPFGIGMVAAGLSCLCAGSMTAQVVVDAPRTTSVDYPHVRLSSEGIAAPSCYEVPKLLTGGASGCTDKETQAWLSEIRGWREPPHPHGLLRPNV